MKRRPSGRSYVSSTRSVVGRWCDWGHHIPKQCFFFHWKRTMWLVQREVTALIPLNRRSQVTTRNKRSGIKLKRRPLPLTTMKHDFNSSWQLSDAGPPMWQQCCSSVDRRLVCPDVAQRRKLVPFLWSQRPGDDGSVQRGTDHHQQHLKFSFVG